MPVVTVLWPSALFLPAFVAFLACAEAFFVFGAARAALQSANGVPAAVQGCSSTPRRPCALVRPAGTAGVSATETGVARTAIDESWAELRLFSPAKVNLFLRIMWRREDGFHELASLFQTVGFGDHLLLARLPEGTASDDFTCDMPGVPVDSSNLVVRALQLFREKTGVQQYFKVHLDKFVPAQAGMGGGSGNAATALFAANEMCGRPATALQLELWSAELGSDITFFLSRGTCYCTGRGEILRAVAPLPPLPVWLVKPAAGLSTPLVFQNMDYSELSLLDPEDLLKGFTLTSEAAAEPDAAAAGCLLPEATFINDLEPPAFRVMPELAEMKRQLQLFGFDHVLMSGSGSTIFCVGQPKSGGVAGAGTAAAAAGAAEKPREWPAAFLRRWNGARVWETTFISRPDNPQLWYNQEAPFSP